MKKTIYNKYNKKAINNLPLVKFKGRVIVVVTPEEAEKAVTYLLSNSILGVDTETRPTFKKGESHKVSLLQVATYDTCFLFRLNLTGLTPAITRLLENKKVPMVGLSWHDDLLGLSKRGNFTPGKFIDLQNLVSDIGIEDLSLQKLYANLFNQKISKRARLSNWDAEVLTDKQKEYAAIDAWSCIQLYEEINKLKRSGDFQLIKVENDDEMLENNKTKK